MITIYLYEKYKKERINNINGFKQKLMSKMIKELEVSKDKTDLITTGHF